MSYFDNLLIYGQFFRTSFGEFHDVTTERTIIAVCLARGPHLFETRTAEDVTAAWQ